MRAWERRYRVVEPNRSDTNRRLYSEEDLERVRLLVRLVDRGQSISAIAALSLEELKSMLSTMDTVSFEQACQDNVPPDYSRPNLSPAMERYIQKTIELLLSDNPWDLRLIVREARIRSGLEEFLLDYTPNVLHKAGLLVFQGNLRIWRNHLLGQAIKQELMGIHLDLLSGVAPRNEENGIPVASGPVLVGTTIEGNFHEIGIFISMILANFTGLRGHYLGPALPAREVAEAVKTIPNGIAVIGISELPPGVLPKSVLEFTKELRGYLEEGNEIWLGGNLSTVTDDEMAEIPNVRIFRSLLAYRARLDSYLGKK